jgi:hypothetical protein
MLTSSSSIATFDKKKKKEAVKPVTVTRPAVRGSGDFAEAFEKDQNEVKHFWEGARFSFAINKNRIKSGIRVKHDARVEQRIMNNIRQKRNSSVKPLCYFDMNLLHDSR